jgi:predicted ester cyclase
MKQFLGGLFHAFPDLHFTADAAYGEGDRIAWHGSLQGTMKNDFGPIPATGKVAEVPLAEFYRLENDKIAEAWVFIDSLWLMQQLGVIPTPGGATT